MYFGTLRSHSSCSRLVQATTATVQRVLHLFRSARCIQTNHPPTQQLASQHRKPYFQILRMQKADKNKLQVAILLFCYKVVHCLGYLDVVVLTTAISDWAIKDKGGIYKGHITQILSTLPSPSQWRTHQQCNQSNWDYEGAQRISNVTPSDSQRLIQLVERPRLRWHGQEAGDATEAPVASSLLCVARYMELVEP